MKYYIIAGEPSGDLYGGQLIRSLEQHDKTAEFRFWGGDHMKAAHPNIAKHIRETSFMGFIEVLMNYRTIRELFAFCKEDILAFEPDVIIYIDYPGFNLRIARWAHAKKFKNFYFIPPKVWAWKESRVEKLRAYIDQIFIIFPFEKAYYASKQLDAIYLGNPLVENIGKKRKSTNEHRHLIALLPGSRKQEIQRHLSLMIELASHYPQEQFAILQAPGFNYADYDSIKAAKYQNIHLAKSGAHELFSQSKAAVVCSGTATLECAAYEVPQVVIYKAHPVSYAIAKSFVKVPYISLVNLIMDKEIVRELIQEKANVDQLKEQLDKLLTNPGSMQKEYLALMQTLNSERAMEKIAGKIHQLLS